MTEKLLPCPFCGSQDLESKSGQIFCNSCFARGDSPSVSFCETKNDVIFLSDLYKLCAKVCEQLERLNNNLEHNEIHKKSVFDESLLDLVKHGESRIAIKCNHIYEDSMIAGLVSDSFKSIQHCKKCGDIKNDTTTSENTTE